MTLAYRAEWRAYSLSQRGQSEKAREPGQNGKQKGRLGDLFPYLKDVCPRA